MDISHLFIGFASGLVIGVALACHAFSRAMVFGLIAGVIIGGIVVDGVEGYLNWTAHFLTEMEKFAAFWTALIAGLAGGAAIVWLARPPTHPLVEFLRKYR